MIKITENLDKAKFEMLKAHVVNVLSAPEKWVATKDRSRMVTHWGRKWEFECESDTECFTTESIFDAVDWLYAEQDPYKEESKPELEVKFSAEVSVQVTDEYIEKAKREAQIEMVHRIKTYSLSVSFENAKNLNKTGNCFYDGKIEAYKDINEMCEALLYRLGEED